MVTKLHSIQLTEKEWHRVINMLNDYGSWREIVSNMSNQLTDSLLDDMSDNMNPIMDWPWSGDRPTFLGGTDHMVHENARKITFDITGTCLLGGKNKRK
jgi:hypothetical protein